MPNTKPYNREHAVEYAHKWALSRNPLFANYTEIGGDCTNFVSQCVYAGSCQMNYVPVLGWYYINSGKRTASWTGVQFFYNFITKNDGAGPFGDEVDYNDIEIGDVVQLGNEDGVFYHTLIVTGFYKGQCLVSAHTDDSVDRKLGTYMYSRIRYIHIKGVRTEGMNRDGSYINLLDGRKL